MTKEWAVDHSTLRPGLRDPARTNILSCSRVTFWYLFDVAHISPHMSGGHKLEGRERIRSIPERTLWGTIWNGQGPSLQPAIAVVGQSDHIVVFDSSGLLVDVLGLGWGPSRVALIAVPYMMWALVRVGVRS